MIDMYAGAAPNPARSRAEPAPLLTCWAVERALHRQGALLGLDPVRVRAVLVSALLVPVHQALGPVREGTVRLGVAYGRRRLLRVGGVRLLVPARGGLLEPSSVSLVHRTPTGPVRVVSHVPFATRPALQAAARAHGVCPEVAVGLVAAVVAQLGLHHVPTGAVVRGHLQGRTWEAMRLVEVVPRVGRPEQQIHLSDARHLIETVALGEQVGVSLPREDWLTPLLHWVARPG